MAAPAQAPPNAAQGKGAAPEIFSAPNDVAAPLDSLKIMFMFVALVLVCGVAAYMLSAANKQDDKADDADHSTDRNHTAVMAPRLVCVMSSAPAYGKKGEVAYSSCDYLVYYAKPEKFDPHVPYDIRGVKILVGFNADDADDAEYFQKLASWLGKRYAVMDLNIASDFSDAGAAGQKVRDALAKIKKERDRPELAVLGVAVRPKDEDATKENGEKLNAIARGAMVVFQAHATSVVSGPCVMRLNQAVITKKNYEKLAEGLSGLVALSTTVAVVKFVPSDPTKTSDGDRCDGYQILSRNDKVCGSLSFDKARAVHEDFVYECNTNASAQALFVRNETHPSASWKFNVAFFDVDRYFPHNDTKCPAFKLANFYRKGPEKAATMMFSSKHH